MALEDFPAELKRRSSAVTRLRGWVGSDPARQGELADELVQLTAVRLDACAYADAAADAQESVTLAGRLLASHGSLGPYTPAADAARFVTATIQLADVQTGLGLPQAAASALATVRSVGDHLPGMAVVSDASTALRACLAGCYAYLSGGNTESAARAAEGALAAAWSTDSTPAMLRLRALTAVAITRWERGEQVAALAWSWEAVEHCRRTCLVTKPARVNPERLRYLTAPVVGVYQAMAERLAHTGDLTWAIALDREALDYLAAVAGRVSEASVWASQARLMLATHLLAAERFAEALDAVRGVVAGGPESAIVQGRAHVALGEPEAALTVLEPLIAEQSENPGTPQVVTTLRVYAEALVAAGEDDSAIRAELGKAGTSTSDSETVAALEPGVLDMFTPWFDPTVVTAEAGRVARQWDVAQGDARTSAIEAERDIQGAAERQRAERLRDAERAAREQARREADEREQTEARAEQLRRRERAREKEQHAAERAETKRRRQARIDQHRLVVAVRDAEQAVSEHEARLHDAQPDDGSESLAAGLEQARADLDAARAALDAAESPLPQMTASVTDSIDDSESYAEPEMTVAQVGDQPPTDLAESPPEVNEPVVEDSPGTSIDDEPGQVDVERIDPVAEARRTRDDARTLGNRRALREATEHLADVLRPRAEADPETLGVELIETLRELSSLRLRGGDLFGSRAAANQAKALARQWS